MITVHVLEEEEEEEEEEEDHSGDVSTDRRETSVISDTQLPWKCLQNGYHPGAQIR